MVAEDVPEMKILDKRKPDHKVTDLYYSLNFELTKISDSKASTLIVIAGQSILITAFLLANIMGDPNAMPIAIGFSVSVIFNVIAISLAIGALRPRSFQETSTSLQPLYTHITSHTKEQFIQEFLKLHYSSKEENDKHYAEIIYQIATILRKKMHYVHIGSRLLFIGIGALAVSIFILVILIFV